MITATQRITETVLTLLEETALQESPRNENRLLQLVRSGQSLRMDFIRCRRVASNGMKDRDECMVYYW